MTATTTDDPRPAQSDSPAAVGVPGVVGIVMPVALHRGGCETMLLNLLRANRGTVGQAYAVCFLDDGPMVEDVRQLGYPATVVRAGRLRQPVRFALAVVRLAAWARRERVVQLISWMEKAHLYASPAGWLARVPAAWWLHSVGPQSRLLRLVGRLPANHVFSDSQAALDLQAPSVPRRPSTVCHCAVDLTRFAADRLPPVEVARRELGLPVDRPIVGVVARLQRWKGLDVFVRAAARLLAPGGPVPAPHFVIVGGAHDLEPGVREELEALIDRLGVRPHLTLAGYQADVARWMQAFDVAVHCSTGIESFGTVIVEAMALGKCVVAANAGGPTEIITDGVDGRLTAPGDDAALAAAVGDLLADGPANRAMRDAARSRAAHFSADRLARCLGQAVARLCGR